jgi:hypothetical protein
MNCGWLLVRHGYQGCMSSLCTRSWGTFSWYPQITLEGDGLILCERKSQHYDNVHYCCCFFFFFLIWPELTQHFQGDGQGLILC